MTAGALERNNAEVVSCRRCPRLVAFRERVAREKRPANADETYWGRPVPGFGDPAATILLVGLAPAAHGGNRTGRIFTGDRSADFLYTAMFDAGLANQATSTSRDDGLALRSTYVTAVNRCVPPKDRPTGEERANCRPYLMADLAALERLRVIVAIGQVAWDGVLAAMRMRGIAVSPKPRFAHAAEVALGDVTMLGTYHTSPHNTFTGRLTPAMLTDVLRRAAELGGVSPPADPASRPPRARGRGAGSGSSRARGSG